MFEIPLEPLPRQDFSIRLDGDRYEIRIAEIAGNTLTVDIVRNGVTLVTGTPAIANGALLPYRYQWRGNFAFRTPAGELPHWQNFGGTCQLIYASPEELTP